MDSRTAGVAAVEVQLERHRQLTPFLPVASPLDTGACRTLVGAVAVAVAVVVVYGTLGVFVNSNVGAEVFVVSFPVAQVQVFFDRVVVAAAVVAVAVLVEEETVRSCSPRDDPYCGSKI